MNFFSHIKEALANLVTSKLRSFLAILGILVGTASVVALITSSQLATAHALSQIKALGTNLLAMDIQQQQQNPAKAAQQQQSAQLTSGNMPSLMKASNEIVKIAPYINLFESVVIQGQQVNSQVLGATASLADIIKIQLSAGRFVSSLDRSSFYCVIGSKLAAAFKAKGISNPIGKQIQLGNWLFTIIGVTEPWTPNFFIYADINNGVIIPLDTSYLLSSYAQINNVLFQLVPQPDINQAQQKIKDKMSQLLPSLNVTFRNPQQLIDLVAKQQATFTYLLGSIGGISLLVGGIGVMNIMLVSVVERRREIGIRMAIGARRSDIRHMFLIEAVILTLLGGIIGIIIGILASFILAVATGWQFFILPIPPILGFVVSVFVGIVSGFYPAYSASKLDPIETLRSD